MKWLRRIGVGLLAIAMLVVGRWTTTWWPLSVAEEQHEHVEAQGAEQAGPTLWTCPMHPEIKLPDPGPCPKCGMDLVPLAEGEDDTGPRQLAMSPAAVKLANIQTLPVSRQFLTLPVRMVGKVDYDETRVRTIAARVPGRLDRLYVDYTGIAVKKQDHLVWLYSPELLTAQQELIEAKKRVQATAAEPSEFLAGSNQRGYESAREKLLLWGLTKDQVDDIEKKGKAEDHMLIRSPTEGVVIDKRLNEGDYVKEGTAIYRIADLSHLWIQLDAYEQDLPWLRYGQSVSVNTEAFPGEVFEGWISFLDPTVDEKTRTVRVRVTVENPDGKLKPGMFVRAIAHSRIGEGGQVLEPRLVGKWISPMHPEVVKDGPGQCDVCGMDLVPAESLGYSSRSQTSRPIVVPASAVLVTGTRAVVYVEVAGKKKPTYEGREVILGPRAGDFFIVRAGLEENERVVVNGAFRIDSSMQIQAKPSMMSMQGDANSFTGPDTAVFRSSLEPVYRAYVEMQTALAADDVATARAGARKIRESLQNVNVGGLPREARARWDEERQILAMESKASEDASSIASVREHFGALSRSVLTLERTFRHADSSMRFEAFCPMAFDNKGASWLQESKDIRNPFFGASMLSCGEIRAELPGASQETRPATGKPKDDTQGKQPAPTRVEPSKPKTEATPKRNEPDVPDFASVYGAYFEMHKALAGDNEAEAKEALGRLTQATEEVDVPRLSLDAQEAWRTFRTAVAESRKATSISMLRTFFSGISDHLLVLHELVGHTEGGTFYRVHCPMAFNKGADWLQTDRAVANPYYGSKMFSCGSVTKELPPSPKRTGNEERQSPDARGREGMGPLFANYFDLQTALAADKATQSLQAFQALQDAARSVGTGQSDKAKAAIEALRKTLVGPAPSDIAGQRARFETISNALLSLQAVAGHPGDASIYRIHCPMAFDNKGADWIQRDKTVANPYFGSRMLRCGSVKAELKAEGEQR